MRPRLQPWRSTTRDSAPRQFCATSGRVSRRRRQLLPKTCRVYTRLQDLIVGAKAGELSLAVFKPSRITKFIWETEERNWDPAKVAELREKSRQGELFAEEAWRTTFKLIPKLPYSFSYRFEDEVGQISEMQILDWEIGALYWNCLKDAGSEDAALMMVRAKYFDQFTITDLHFFLGTTQEFHFIAPSPWVIVGVFPIPFESQPALL
jgi:hypothetical protein